MGIYVPFMFMPDNCKQCLVNDSCIYCKITSSSITDYKRPIDCPLMETKVDSRFSGAKDAVKLNIENTAYVAKQMYDECKLLGFNDKQAFQMSTLYLKMKSGEDKVWVK